MKKVKIGIDVFMLLILLAGLVTCIYEYIRHSECGGECFFGGSVLMYELILFMSFVIVAVLFYLIIRLIFVFNQRKDTGNIFPERKRVKTGFDIASFLIILIGQVYCIAEYVFALNCHGNSAAPYYVLLLIFPIVFIAAIFWGLSRLILVLVNNLKKGMLKRK